MVVVGKLARRGRAEAARDSWRMTLRGSAIPKHRNFFLPDDFRS